LTVAVTPAAKCGDPNVSVSQGAVRRARVVVVTLTHDMTAARRLVRVTAT
jgi:hypothetical protein